MQVLLILVCGIHWYLNYIHALKEPQLYCQTTACLCWSVCLCVIRCVWWVWHRSRCSPLVSTQCLPALWHGNLHGSAGAPQHGDRVSVCLLYLCCHVTALFRFLSLIPFLFDRCGNHWEQSLKSVLKGWITIIEVHCWRQDAVLSQKDGEERNGDTFNEQYAASQKFFLSTTLIYDDADDGHCPFKTLLCRIFTK